MKNLGKLHKLLNTLSDTNRLRIIQCIGNHQERSVGEIAIDTGLSQPLVSHHLRTLKKNAIVQTNRKGPFIYYRLSSPQIIDVLGILSELSENVDRSEPTMPMFPCPPWWRKMNQVK
jgi:DNA-binding transcriptional ArsR family regulator